MQKPLGEGQEPGHILVQRGSREPCQGRASSPVRFSGTFNATAPCKGPENTDTSCPPHSCSCSSPQGGPQPATRLPRLCRGQAKAGPPLPGPGCCPRRASSILPCSQGTAQSSVTSGDSADLHGGTTTTKKSHNLTLEQMYSRALWTFNFLLLFLSFQQVFSCGSRTRCSGSVRWPIRTNSSHGP